MSSNLFVEEDEDHYEEEVDIFADDPIIDSIPLVLNTLPAQNQSIHVIQYPGRPKTKPLNEGTYKALIKEDSNYLEVKVPLDTAKFFDTGRVETWGDSIGEQGLQGVLDNAGGGLYVGQIVQDSNGNRKVVLIPVDSTAQLRPSFKYLDDLDALAMSQRRAESQDAAAASGNRSANVQILQTSGKANPQQQGDGGFGNQLGESLRHVKRYNEEEWSSMKWKTSEEVGTLKERLLDGADGIKLATETRFGDYLHDLLNEPL